MGHSSGSSTSQPVLWTPDGGVVALADLVDPAALWHEQIAFANDGNESGSIAVTGRVRDSVRDQVNPAGAGFVLVPVPPRWSVHGAGWPGTQGTPTIAASAPPVPCTSFSIELGSSSGAPAPGLLAVGTQPAELPTPFGGTLPIGDPEPYVVVLGAGGGSVPVALACDPALQGTSYRPQACQLDRGASHGVAFRPGRLLELW